MFTIQYYRKMIALISTAALVSTLLISCSGKDIELPSPPMNDTIPRDTNTSDTSHSDTTYGTTYSYLALGDSYTIGQNVAEAERFPMQAAAWLTSNGISVKKPDIIAVTGWTCQNLLDAIDRQQPAKNYDVVTLLIGVNDQYQRRDTTGYREQFRKCLNKAIEHVGGKRNHVFVLSIPDYGVTPFGGGNPAISVQIDQFNAINKAVTAEYGISYTDITPDSKKAATDKSLIASDGLHPSGKQYTLWVQLLAPKMEALLK